MNEIYLSKLVLNLRSRRVHREISDRQELHRTISAAFPPVENPEHLPKHERKTPRNAYNLLHRLDIYRSCNQAVLLVQSCIKPDWSSLHENFTLEVSCKTVHEQYTNIQSGMRLIFRLQANPTKRIGKSDNKADARFKDAKKRRRVELRTDEERIRWLKRKGEENGFRLAKVRVAPVENAAVIAQSRIKAWRKNDQKTMTFASVLFEGVLEVTDAEALRNALIRGIGPGKAYGFGLLSVAPIPD